MTEQEAAAELCALLNKIEEAGYEVAAAINDLWVGDTHVASPPSEGEPWEVRES